MPTVNPLTTANGSFTLLKLIPAGPVVPDTQLHVPVPDVAPVADSVAEVTLHNIWSGPASAIDTAGNTVMVLILEYCGAHTPLFTDTRYFVVPPRFV